MFKRNNALEKDEIYLSGSMGKYLKIIWAVCGVFLLLPLVASFMPSSSYVLTLGSLVLIYSVIAMGVDLLTGYMGLSSLGHAGFFGFAAYCSAYFSITLGFPIILAILMAIGMTVILSSIYGIVINRVWGTTFQIVNIALGQIVWGLAFKLTAITKGETGFLGIKRPDWFGIDFENPVNFYYLLFVAFALVLFFLYRLVDSVFGMTVMGIKQNRKRMSALGYNVYLHKFITYVFSGIFAGIAGIMFCFFFRLVTPSNASAVTSSKAFLMALVGGTGTIIGPIVGATILVTIENIVSAYTDRWVTVLGAIYILTVTFAPRGVIGIYNQIRNSIRGKAEAKAAEEAERAEQVLLENAEGRVPEAGGEGSCGDE